VTELPLRERKKRRTRAEIADAAGVLFSRRGFEAVTVDEIARVAGVSKQTVFNYFPTKEDLFFSRAAEQREAMLAAVRDRPPGVSLVDAFRGYLRSFWMEVSALALDQPHRGFWAVLSESPALLAHGREVNAANVAALARLVQLEAGASDRDLRPHVMANALAAPHAAVFDHWRRRILTGEHPPDLAEELLDAADRAYEMLEHGIASACLNRPR